MTVSWCVSLLEGPSVKLAGYKSKASKHTCLTGSFLLVLHFNPDGIVGVGDAVVLKAVPVSNDADFSSFKDGTWNGAASLHTLQKTKMKR